MSNPHPVHYPLGRFFYIFKVVKAVWRVFFLNQLIPFGRCRRPFLCVLPLYLFGFILHGLCKVASSFIAMASLLRRPMVEEIIGEASIICAMINAIVCVVGAEVLDADHAAIYPLLAYDFFRYSVGKHMEVYSVRVLAPAHVYDDFGVRVVILQPPHKVVADPLCVGEVVDFIVISEG